MNKMHIAIAALSAALLVCLTLLISGAFNSEEPTSRAGMTQEEFSSIIEDEWYSRSILEIVTLCAILEESPGEVNSLINETWSDPLERKWTTEFFHDRCEVWNDVP